MLWRPEACARHGALQEHPQLQPLILRKFRSAGDVELAQQLVLGSRGIQRAKDLAAEHALLAADAVRPPASVLHSCLWVGVMWGTHCSCHKR